jgi:hypothetical protein
MAVEPALPSGKNKDMDRNFWQDSRLPFSHFEQAHEQSEEADRLLSQSSDYL